MNNKTICTLDIGGNKICCCIASVDVVKKNPNIKVLSYYATSSKSFKNGVINDIKNLTNDIGHVVQSAEDMADVVIDEIVVSFPGAMCESVYTKVRANLEGDIITEQYLDKLLTKSYNRAVDEKNDVILFLPVNYSINARDGVKQPIGQYSDDLGIDIHYIKTNRSFKKNLEQAIVKNRLEIMSFCNSAYASGLACLTEDEKELGSTVIDIGESSCDIAMFKGGCLIYTFSLLGGGGNITNDIKSNLKCSMATAERLKIMKGDLNSYTDRGFVEYKEDGENSQIMLSKISNYDFHKIIREGIDKILEDCHKALEENPFYQVTDNAIVITGGVSSTSDITSMAEKVFKRPVRLGKSINTSSMPTSYDNPASVSSIGLIRYALENLIDSKILADNKKNKKSKKILEWFKENL